jgi:hypothetical protein
MTLKLLLISSLQSLNVQDANADPACGYATCMCELKRTRAETYAQH